MSFDIAIAGAGPAGLSLARALAPLDLKIALIERLPAAQLADPPFDGREIALTQLSAKLMRELGLWQRIDAAEISPLRSARVLNGPSPFAMVVEPDQQHGELGFLVPNYLIRRAAFDVVRDQPGVTLLDGRSVRRIRTDADAAVLTLDNGDTITARLAIAADSRFSETRRAMGIGADMVDFGRTMMVYRMDIERPHDNAAWEWFGYGQTLALLPLAGNRASVVLTLPHHQIEALLALSDEQFDRDMERRFDHRLGAMHLASTRHPYPLVAVYARRFTARRFACVGDAAVGMHPVTAHGFNFGLRGAVTLARGIATARQRGTDFAAADVLEPWEREHRIATRPLYLATNAIARLYCDDSPPARLVRNLALRTGQQLGPVRHALTAAVSGTSERPPLLSRLAGTALATLRPRHRESA
ncbi:MAG: 5-demethoxyubiquinol-8 5-hydroxylase UbiM [Gammaproteobacteria bacterium]|nr:5-demethoxyubiquinol-8 5-hydroxylase UbiM [Gammaproteobacteria bacterium]